MALASGLGHTTAIAEETTYGTAPSLTGIRGYEVDSNTVEWEKITAQGGGLRGSGLVARSNRRAVVAQQAGGEVSMDFATKGMGLWLRQAMGGYSIAQVGATPAFLHTFTLTDLISRSFTMQTGMPDSSGALQPYTYTGCKISEWGIDAPNREIAKFNATIDARNCSVGVGYATPSYTLASAANVFSFAGAALYQQASSTAVMGNLSFGLEVSNNLNTDRFHTGQAGLKGNPLNAGWVEPVLTAENEYADQVSWVARNFTDEAFAVRMEYRGAVISGAEVERLSILIPAVRINSGNPTVDGPEVLSHTVEMQVLDNGVDPVITVELVSTDTAA